MMTARLLVKLEKKRRFQAKWTNGYFVVRHGLDKVMCFICKQANEMLKEFNINRHYSREARRERERRPSPTRRAAPRRAGRTQRRAPPEKDAHSPRRAPHHHPGVPGIPPPQPQVRARTPQGRPAPHSRQPSARPTVGPGRSEAGARRPRPRGGNPGEERGPTRGVVNMARPGSATVGNLAGPSAQEQGPEPTPQGHEHSQLRCPAQM
uniref:SPIN-DOC-like zinc-finger domain-containing protein n=1 Tax=Oryzias latipes TaxID=8090 RepID=A0A3P9JS39_ORYLA